MSCGGMQPCIDKIILRSFKIQAFGLLDELDFLKVGEGVHKVLPDGSDGVAVDEGFDVDDFRLEPSSASVAARARLRRFSSLAFGMARIPFAAGSWIYYMIFRVCGVCSNRDFIQFLIV